MQADMSPSLGLKVFCHSATQNGHEIMN